MKQTKSEILDLLVKATLPCTDPGGRFNEDACEKCPNCQLRKIRADYVKEQRR